MKGHSQKRLSKTKGTRWRAMVYVDKEHAGSRGAHWECFGTYGLKREADAKIDDVLKAYREQGAQASTKLTVADMIGRYMASRKLAPTTRQRYEHDREAIAESELGERRASGVIPVEWTEYFAALEPALSPKSIANRRLLAHAAYKWAVRGRLLTYNPVADTDPPAIDRSKGPAPTVARVRAALEVIVGKREEGAALLMAGGGLRDGEAAARRWSHVDWHVSEDPETHEQHLEGGVLVMSQYTQTRDSSKPKGQRLLLHLTPPKSRTGERYVPLPEGALLMLADLKRRQQLSCIEKGATWTDDRLVSCRADGSPIPPNQLSSQLGIYWRAAGFAEMHPHLLRHAFITELIVRQRVDAQTAADLAGHANPSTTLGYYTHTDDPAKRAAVQSLSRAWEAEPERPAEGSGDQVATKPADVVPMARAKGRRKGSKSA